MRQDEIRSPGAHDDDSYVTLENRPEYGLPDWTTSDPFHVYGGEWSLFRSSRADRFFARADAVVASGPRVTWRGGLGGTYDAVPMPELDGFPFDRNRHSPPASRSLAPGPLRFRFPFPGGSLPGADATRVGECLRWLDRRPRTRRGHPVHR